MSPTPARRAALTALRAVRRGELLDRALERAAAQVPLRERAWLQELVYGTVRLRGRLDYMLDALLRRGLESVKPDVLDTLRLGAYQLLEMGSVPAYAAVSQAVEMAREVAGQGATGLVNGVLQSLRREAPGIAFPSFEADPVGYLATWGSHPRWLVERWLAAFGTAGARALVDANNRRPELYLRPVGATVTEAADRLEAAGITTSRVAHASGALCLEEAGRVAEALAVVPAIVQDPAAGLVPPYAAPPAGATVADLCAAPGGKAVALGETAGIVVAADISASRLQRLSETVARLGELAGRVRLVVADARRPPFRAVDVVLVDAPCTGTGTFRRHPDGKWRLRPADLEALVALQREILAAAATVVRPGGVLVYATCSLEAEENERQMEWFLDAYPDFTAAPAHGVVGADLLDEAGRLCVLPQRTGFDGAFAARLARSV